MSMRPSFTAQYRGVHPRYSKDIVDAFQRTSARTQSWVSTLALAFSSFFNIALWPRATATCKTERASYGQQWLLIGVPPVLPFAPH